MTLSALLCLALPARAQTIDVRVAASTDDAEQRGTGSMYLNSSDLELTRDSDTQVVGMRWVGLAIPQGATITAAWIQFTCETATSEVTTLTLRGQAADAAGTFTSTASEISARPLTTASVGWAPNAWTAGAAGPDQRTPDLRSLIQEIVSRPSWVAGNPLAIIITGTGQRVAYSFDKSAATSPLLHVEYTSSGPPPNLPPVAVLNVAQVASPDLTVSASAAGSSDTDANPIASYSFTFGDGTPPVVTTHPTVTATHTYAAAGTYTVTLTATDTGGLTSAPVTRSVVVNPPGLVTLDLRIAASADDAEESSTGTVSINNADLELIQDASNQVVGMRWPAVSIPAGATILSAWIQFTSRQADSGPTTVTFQGQAANTAAAFTTAAGNVSSRPRTAASVSWTPNAWASGAVGADQRTPNLSAVIQQIVSRAGWASGNALAIIVTGSGRRTAWAFDGAAASAPLLHIEYSTSGGPLPNSPPVAQLALTQPLLPLFSVNASAAGSTDTDFNPIETYTFTFGDGTPAVVTTAPTSSASHTYAAAGTYTVTVRATDTGGLQSSLVSQPITITPPVNTAPVANLVVTQLATPALTVSASGAGSTDTDSYPIVSYSFTFGDGTPAVVTNAPTSATTHTYAATGSYTVTLTATDAAGATSAPVSQTITVNPPPNQPPVANLSVTQVANPPQTVSASAAGSTDTDANPIASYSFTFGDGTAPVIVSAPTVVATHTYAAPGTYTVTLTATDTGGLTSTPVTRSITVLPAGVFALEARIATSADDAEEHSDGSINLSSSDLEMTLDGTAQTVGLRWPGLAIPQGATINTAWVQFGAKQADTQVTNLTIQGHAVAAAPAFTSTALGISTRPRTAAAVTWTPNAWTSGAVGSDQRTPDLKSVIQQIVGQPGWASGNALALIVTGTGRRTGWSFNGNASLAPLLHVEYATGPPPPNDPPVASLTVTQVTEPAFTVNASGAGSTDTDAFPIASYSFTFGDGSAPVVVNAPTSATTHTYAAAGTYTVTLTVTDAGGLASAPVSMNVNVLPPPNQPPVANLTVAQAANPPLTATASAAGSTDPDTEPIASYSFNFGDGSPAVVTTPPTVIATHTYAAAGTYTVTLTATDTGGLTSLPVSSPVTITPPVITTVEKRVAASADDAEQASTGSVSIVNTDLELAVDGSVSQTVGMRWTGLAIPQGATINAAWIQFTARIANSGAANLTFQGEAANAAAAFTTATNNVSSRVRTTASTSWAPNAWASGASGADQRTPDLKNVIQEVVNRSGWVSGNPLAVIVTGTGTRTAWSFNGSSSGAALLHVEYVGSGAPANQPPVGQLAVNQAASPPLTVSASAAGSSDPDNSIASYRFVWGDGTAATVVNHPTQTATHTYASAGTYTVTLTVTDALGAQSTPVTQSVLVSSTPSQVAVYVGYYDTHHSNLLRPKPNPWQGSPGVTFVGTPDSPSGGWDSSAIRLDNLTAGSLTVTVTVDMISHQFALWGSRTIPAGGKLVLAQTGFENFDGSDTSPAGCYDCNPNDCLTKVESTVPVVKVTIGGTTTNYYDVDQIMNTKGVDGAGCPYTGTRNDESSNWVQIGTNPNAVIAEEALVATENREGAPDVPVLAMAAPYPNPTADGVVLRFSVATRGRTQITLYDVAGRRVMSLLDWELQPGRYQRSADLSALKAGVYFCELRTPTGKVKTSLIVSR